MHHAQLGTVNHSLPKLVITKKPSALTPVLLAGSFADMQKTDSEILPGC